MVTRLAETYWWP